MQETAKLIKVLAARIESGKAVDFSNILDIHREIKTVHQSLQSRFGDNDRLVRAARDADHLIEKIIFEYVANTSAALHDLAQIVSALHKSTEPVAPQEPVAQDPIAFQAAKA
jgi:regulator of sigma D